MTQVNVTPPRDRGDRTAAAGINLVTVLIGLAVLAAIVWFLFTGPLAGMGTSGGDTTINVNPPAQQEQAPNVDIKPETDINVNPPAQQEQPHTGAGTSSQ